MGFWTSQRQGFGARKAGAKSAKQYGDRGVQDVTAGELAGGAGADILAQRYASILSGETPSIAEMQMKRAYGQAMGGTQAMVAGATGANRALAQRSAMQQRGRLTGDMAREGSILRAQEQAQAAQQFGGLVGQQQQHALTLEQIMAQNYAQQMGQLQGQTKGWGSQVLGGLMSAGGAIAGGALAGGAGGAIGGIGGAIAGGAASGLGQGIGQSISSPIPQPNWRG